MPDHLVVLFCQLKFGFVSFYEENYKIHSKMIHFGTSQIKQNFTKITKLHEMIGYGQKNDWEHQFGVGTYVFDDLGCRGRYSLVFEKNVYVDAQNPEVGFGGEKNKNKSSKSHNISRNDWKWPEQ